MAADKQAVRGRLGLQNLSHPRFVAPRIPADVRHKNRHALALKSQVERHDSPDIHAVNIAIYPAQRLEILQFVHQTHVAKIARVPHLVAFGEVLEHLFVEVGMGVGH